MATGDIYEVTLHGTLQGQRCDNVFHYEQDVEYISSAPNVAYDVFQSFNAEVLPVIRNIASVDMLWTEIKVRNLFNASDQTTQAISVTGNLATSGNDTAASFNAIAFSLTGDDPAVKQGAKRFAGLLDGYQSDGILDAGAGLTAALTNVSAILEAPLHSYPLMLTELFIPVVVKRVREGTPGAYTYRLPSSPAEKVVSHVLVALWDVYVSSQISRKIGRGV